MTRVKKIFRDVYFFDEKFPNQNKSGKGSNNS